MFIFSILNHFTASYTFNSSLTLWYNLFMVTGLSMTILMSAYNFDEDLIFLKYMEEGIIDSIW